MKVVVVFDAKESGLPSHRESRASVDIVFAADACADSWIKREVYLLRDDGCPKIRVITSDSLHQQVANGAIKDVRKELEQLLHSDRDIEIVLERIVYPVSPCSSSPKLLIYVQAMVDICEIGNTVPGEFKSPEEEIRDSRLNYTEDEELEQLIHGNVCMVDYPGEGSKDCRIGRRVVLSGDFNPLHEGHLTLMSTACTKLIDNTFSVHRQYKQKMKAHGNRK
ncbi:hypothetical protein SELMODRAFT_426874 [Selaginella moellendorffii]|uniref:Cytidyltransferase-like domain-containing protein n=1 Tax=Selaginella moellendorffii TaxID=88036 RepID=D8SXS7_SELML|nr:hypothetical protein SELMODRAFT_426874 [Selaginella moellendorffii]